MSWIFWTVWRPGKWHVLVHHGTVPTETRFWRMKFLWSRPGPNRRIDSFSSGCGTSTASWHETKNEKWTNSCCWVVVEVGLSCGFMLKFMACVWAMAHGCKQKIDRTMNQTRHFGIEECNPQTWTKSRHWGLEEFWNQPTCSCCSDVFRCGPFQLSYRSQLEASTMMHGSSRTWCALIWLFDTCLRCRLLGQLVFGTSAKIR